MPLLFEGEPIGDVSGNLDAYVLPDRSFVRLTAMQRDVVVHLDKNIGALSRGGTKRPKPIDPGGDLVPERLDLCVGHDVVPIGLRSIEEAATASVRPTTTVTVRGKVFVIDEVELCFADADVSSPFALVIAHWDAPDGTRVIIERPSDATRTTTFRSRPTMPEQAILALLLADAGFH